MATRSAPITAEARRFVFYAGIGGAGTLLDLAIFAALVGAGLWIHLANGLGYLTGTLVSFHLNRRITFAVGDRRWLRLALFLAVGLAGFAASALVLGLSVELLGLAPLRGKVLSMGVVVVLQYTLNSRITFRRAGGRTGP